jgi:hypothetical protein
VDTAGSKGAKFADPVRRLGVGLWPSCGRVNRLRPTACGVWTKGHFPNGDAVRKLIYLAIHNAVPQWNRTRGWTKALLASKIQFGDRLPD